LNLLYVYNQKQEKRGLAESFRPENFIPGLIIGFIFGLFLDLSNPSKNQTKKKNFLPGKSQQQCLEDGDKELKLVCVQVSFAFSTVSVSLFK
jgi:PTH2 family peptidyl-tRNA hydrolase